MDRSSLNPCGREENLNLRLTHTQIHSQCLFRQLTPLLNPTLHPDWSEIKWDMFQNIFSSSEAYKEP